MLKLRYVKMNLSEEKWRTDVWQISIHYDVENKSTLLLTVTKVYAVSSVYLEVLSAFTLGLHWIRK